MSIEQLQLAMNEASSILFFGGAGVSTESGIPDFRSVDGLYHQHYAHSPETILSHTFFMQQPEIFYQFYREKMLYLDAKPNITHTFLAKLEAMGKLQAIVTQNIDGLHQLAGNKKVHELHGSVHRNHCMQCQEFYPIDAILNSQGVPHCHCGGIIKPDVILYEESLNETVLESAIQAITQADLLIVGGTSLTVYPAAGLLHYHQGKNLFIINKDRVPHASSAITITDTLGNVFSSLRL
ncbi:NAD-dependent protein deacylase [Entomospira culicis]|uniref:protein acetyllysine N-acetyltransferase n=1 Tax=Entomospira culicis TaxID=2719989 RepID=A0A968KUA7_9SPIO|nr:NAD-dependent protein deacylase [Entomospira culicis]NIZ19135.1 NAD-dependent protein deacylase [Entomospira culicis]NIZ69349.1 NAD-dependent protein deacylase [Entomospira culicis]WDI37935.1 NAD-dependent protein deacylase [Entomospira culicis]WDI39562.1 NAD-dependent protein deacylase [Entomospira culicis]